MSSSSRQPVVIDLFCGAGGLSEGLRQAGFAPVVGVDFDKHALATYAANHPESKALLSDIRDVTGAQLLQLAGSSEIDLIAGGPSCQGFSTQGKRDESDPRNFLFKEFVRLVGEVRPKFFLMENVKGLLTYGKGHFREVIGNAFADIGYRVEFTTICAADYGVPQLRHRVLFIGTRLTNVELSFPKPTHGPNSPANKPYITVAEAINDLPLMRGEFRHEIRPYETSPSSEFQRYARKGASSGVTLHQSNGLSGQAALIAAHVNQGEGLRSVPVEVLPDRFKKMRRISNGDLRKDCTTLYYRLHPDRPSYTITCYYRNIASGPFLHPWEDRSLSHREAARLMSFPDRYVFKGSTFTRQIGNAVPPLLGAAIGRHVLKLLETAGGRTTARVYATAK